MQRFKFLVCGEDNVGKISLLVTYTSHEFPSEYVPPVWHNWAGNVVVDGKELNLGFWNLDGIFQFFHAHDMEDR